MDNLFGAIGAGSAFAGIAFVAGLFWKLYVEVRKDRDLYRQKFFEAAGLADVGSKAAEHLVKVPVEVVKQETEGPLHDEIMGRLEAVAELMVKKTSKGQDR